MPEQAETMADSAAAGLVVERWRAAARPGPVAGGGLDCSTSAHGAVRAQPPRAAGRAELRGGQEPAGELRPAGALGADAVPASNQVTEPRIPEHLRQPAAAGRCSQACRPSPTPPRRAGPESDRESLSPPRWWPRGRQRAPGRPRYGHPAGQPARPGALSRDTDDRPCPARSRWCSAPGCAGAERRHRDPPAGLFTPGPPPRNQDERRQRFVGSLGASFQVSSLIETRAADGDPRDDGRPRGRRHRRPALAAVRARADRPGPFGAPRTAGLPVPSATCASAAGSGGWNSSGQPEWRQP